MEGTIIQPDLLVIDDKSQTMPYFIEDVALTGEVKFTENDDPFNNSALDSENGNVNAVERLGQVCAYATVQMAAQFRSHVFSLLIFPRYVRLLRWDRPGLVFTDKILFTKGKASSLSEFLWRYDQATPTERGVDPNVERLYHDSVPTEVRQELEMGKHAFYWFTIPASGCASGTDSHYIVGARQYMGAMSPVGCSTRTFKAFCEETGKYVFLKDT